MLKVMLIFVTGFVLGLVSAVFIDTEIRLNEREGSVWIERWVRFRIFVLYIWERKLFYLVLIGISLVASLLIGSVRFLSEVEEVRQDGWWLSVLRQITR